MDNESHNSFLRRFFTEGRVVVLTILVSCMIILGISFFFSGWVRTSSTTVETKTSEVTTTVTTKVVESGSTTVRTIGFIIAGVVAVVIAVWRGRVANRQAEAARNQVATANRQATIAQRNLESQQLTFLADLCQKATDMLGSPTLAIRLGGIHQLERIAKAHPTEYHVQVMQQLCPFVRHPTEVEGQPTVEPTEVDLGPVYGASTAQDFAAAGTIEIEEVREDIEAAMNSIVLCHSQSLQIETLQNYWLDLHGADLRGVNLTEKDLSRAPVDHEKAVASFGYARFDYLYTNMRAAKLHYASLMGTNLYRVDLSFASGLIQAILDDAYADPRMPPRLEYTFDVDTGEQLVWNSRTEPER